MGYENVVAANKRRAKHGKSSTREYGVWRSMKQRCHNPNNESYGRYGGLGLVVCKRWRDSFQAFLDDMGVAPVGASLDRIDNKKGYNPQNCRWANPTQQQNNMRSNRTITHDGRTMSLAAWARETGVPAYVLKHRLNMGWTPPKLLSKESFKGKTYKYTVEYAGKSRTLKEVSAMTDIPLQTLYWRFNKGLPIV